MNKEKSTKKQKKSLVENSVFYVIYNTLNILFPFLTGIYVARVLLAEDIGEIAYAQNIVQYFVILSFLGIPTYGMREIARVRDSNTERSTVFSELFVINAISTLIFLSIYVTCIFSFEQFQSKISVFLITGISLALNLLNINWLYEGLEEFKFISLRNIAFKIICFLLLVVFVRSESDYLIYAGLTVFGTAGNYIINAVYAPRFVCLKFRGLNLKRHMKSIFLLVAVNLAIEIYSLVDVTMLGNMSEKTSVAFYSYAQRIKRVLLHIVNSFTMVIVPRISYHYKNNEKDEFNRLISQTFKIILILSIPMIIGIVMTGDDIITLMYGKRYIQSAKVLKILSFLLLVSPIGYLLGSRVLLVSRQELKMVFCVGIGAIVNIIGNYYLIQRLDELGAAYASLLSEVLVMVIYVYMGRKEYSLTSNLKDYGKIFIGVISMVLYLFIVNSFQVHDFLLILIEIAGSIIVYFGCLYLMKEPTVTLYANRMLTRILGDWLHFCK